MRRVVKRIRRNRKLEVTLTTSKMGLMRRGGMGSLLGAPSQINRVWERKKDGNDDTTDETTTPNNGEGESTQLTEEEKQKQQEEEEANLDPAQRLILQQRKIEQAKINARVLESSENAGRDPCLFSKRTAFDIRMDQIDDKPWNKDSDLDRIFQLWYDGR